MFEDADFLEPSMLVRHPDHPEWGVGQVQSAIRNKVTVNFTEVGKKVINPAIIKLEIISSYP